jgi:hypothetical protein
MRIAVILLAFGLSGCGGEALLGSVATYQPYVQDITDQSVLTKDMADCRAHALAFNEPLSVTGIAVAGTKGVSSNAAGAAVNPVVPLLGGVGAAGTELMNELNVLGDRQKRVFLICLHDRGERSRAYDVLDPGL